MFDYWALATVQPMREKLAAENLARQDFETYSPLVLEQRVVCGRKVECATPLFRGYMFVRLHDRWRSILGTRGVTGLMLDALEEVPVRIRESEIEKIRSAEIDGVIILEKKVRARRRFAEGDEVMVRQGLALESKIGIFSGDTRQDRMKVLFKMLGREVPIYVRESDLVAV